MNHRKRLVAMALSVALAMCAVSGSAGVPELITYQGRLAASNGSLIDGVLPMTFAIYRVGAATPLWTEVHPAVDVTDGQFSVHLGSVTSFLSAGLAFDEAYELGLAVDSDPEMTPRQLLTSVAYSLNAKRAENALQSAVAELAERALSADIAELANSAASADLADLANRATGADLADLATRATNADLADLATRATNADLADLATRATSADLADLATRATSADLADFATSAVNAEVADLATQAANADVAELATRATVADLADLATRATLADGVADDAVGTAALQDAAVTVEKIADGSITAEKFAPGAATGVAPESLDASHIADGSLGLAELDPAACASGETLVNTAGGWSCAGGVRTAVVSPELAASGAVGRYAGPAEALADLGSWCPATPCRLDIAPGLYTLTSALTVPSGVTVAGSGRGATSIGVDLTAPAAVVLAPQAELRDLTMTFDFAAGMAGIWAEGDSTVARVDLRFDLTGDAASDFQWIVTAGHRVRLEAVSILEGFGLTTGVMVFGSAFVRDLVVEGVNVGVDLASSDTLAALHGVVFVDVTTPVAGAGPSERILAAYSPLAFDGGPAHCSGALTRVGPFFRTELTSNCCELEELSPENPGFDPETGEEVTSGYLEVCS